MDESDYRHIHAAKQLTQQANSDPENMGRIERAMYLTEANNHLLWAILGGIGVHLCEDDSPANSSL